MIVMKFGGTSVADAPAIKRFIGIVRSRLDQKPVVVVSALSKVTNILTEICVKSAEGNYERVVELIEKLELRHTGLSEELFGNDNDRLQLAVIEIKSLLSSIKEVTKAISFLQEISDKRQAEIIGTGELLSNIVINHALNNAGIKCNKIFAREFIFTDNNYLKAKADQEMIIKKAPGLIDLAFKDFQIVLTQGFISTARDGNPSLLGREGSDLSATLIGMAIGAQMIEIWTDVDGIHTTDPRRVENTHSISEMSFNVAEELSVFGAKVLHPLTIEPARKKNIPVKVLNSRDASLQGTLIIDHESVENRGIKSITCKENVVVINIKSNESLSPHDFLNTLFRVLNKYKIKIDLASISQNNVELSFEDLFPLEDLIKEICVFSAIFVNNSKSQITVVGEDLKNSKGMMKNIFDCMEDFTVEMVTGGSSDNSISFLVEKDQLNKIMQVLHDKLFK